LHHYLVVYFHLTKINFMKKFKLLALFFVLFSVSINSVNAQIYPKGSVNFSVGYGAVSYGNIFLNLVTKDLKDVNINRFGPLYIKGEYAVADNFTVGLNVNYSKISSGFKLDSVQYVGKYSGNFSLRSTSAILRANYTIPFAEDRAGFMIGGGVGYRGLTLSYTDDNPKTPVDGGFGIPLPFTFELTMGVRYYITENIGLYLESGVTRSLLQGGITARF
jgi:opacity protein-like surface antigen